VIPFGCINGSHVPTVPFYLSQPCNGQKDLHPLAGLFALEASRPTHREQFIEGPLTAKPSASTSAGLQFGGCERVREEPRIQQDYTKDLLIENFMSRLALQTDSGLSKGG
jgi:hypothetical protein